MSNTNTTVTRRQSDGTVVEVLQDGTTRPVEDATDWEGLRALLSASFRIR